MRDVQARLRALGFDPGPVDGIWGARTKRATLEALARLSEPRARMSRIIVHWTGGRWNPNAGDLDHYHLLINGDGDVITGKHPIRANETIRPGAPYAAHTAGANTGAIGVALCGMIDAREHPFHAGPEPITARQWEALVETLAELCGDYRIPVEPRHVLTHAEVWPVLGIPQSAKWDISVLPWDRSFATAAVVGAQMRSEVRERMTP